MLRLENLSIEVGGKRILQNVNLHVREGEVCVLFGPNGSGKTSLLMTILGNPRYKVCSGRILFKGKDITDLPTQERVRMGMGIAFQNPAKLTNVNFAELLKYCATVGNKSEEEIREYAKMLGIEGLLERKLNVGFSGGELKRSELLQLMLMNPDFVMLDEPDSGIDIDSMALIGKVINELLEREREKGERKKAGIIITHTGHILEHVSVDYGMILYRGRMIRVENPSDILEAISRDGYEEVYEECLKLSQN